VRVRLAGKNTRVADRRNHRARFSPEPETVAAMRRFLRESLAEVDPEVVHDAAVLASEVAANVVEHALTDYEVRVKGSDQVLRVEIADGSSVIPAVQDLAVDAERGRGLQLLAGIAQAWGVEETTTGKYVWFELHIKSPQDH